jgi:ribokinase
MKIWNFGSINIDLVYRVPHIVTPGETLSALERNTSPGGKGLNQSVAIARSGSVVSHVGRIGQDGNWLQEFLSESGVDTSFVHVTATETGHAIIQVDQHSENAIVLFPGANVIFITEEISSILEMAASDDWVLLQNETNCVNEIITEAAQRGLKVAFNAAPAPTDDDISLLPLEMLSLLIVNEGELERITGTASVESGLAEVGGLFPDTRAIVTRGGDGCIYQFQEEQIRIPAEDVEEVVDTTGAGDTFVGYFLAEFASTENVEWALRFATCAAAISVTRSGAAESIPFRHEVLWCLVTKGLSSDLKRQTDEHLDRYHRQERDDMDYEQLLSVVTEFMSQYPEWSWNGQQWHQ